MATCRLALGTDGRTCVLLQVSYDGISRFKSRTHSGAAALPFVSTYSFARHEMVSTMATVHFHCDVTPTEESFMACVGYVGMQETPCCETWYDVADDDAVVTMTDVDIDNDKAMGLALQLMQ